MRNARNCERGQAILEFALIFPVFLLLALGGFGLLMAASARQTVNYIATETAKCIASGTNPSCSDPTAYAQSIAQGLALVVDATRTLTVSSGLACSGKCEQVSVNYNFVPIVPLFPSFAMSGTATATLGP